MSKRKEPEMEYKVKIFSVNPKDRENMYDWSKNIRRWINRQCEDDYELVSIMPSHDDGIMYHTVTMRVRVA